MKSIKDKFTGLTAEILRMLVIYDPATGFFYWRESGSGQGNKRHAGNRAGWKDKYYSRLRFPGFRPFTFQANRMAWLYMTGEWPKNEVDHINHNKFDDRWANLREATHSQNKAFTGLRSHNTSGVTGVSYVQRDDRWQAQCNINGRTAWRKSFKTKEAAIAAREAAVAKYHGEFAFRREP